MNSGIRYECGKCKRSFTESDIKFVGHRMIKMFEMRTDMFYLCDECTLKLYDWLEEKE